MGKSTCRKKSKDGLTRCNKWEYVVVGWFAQCNGATLSPLVNTKNKNNIIQEIGKRRRGPRIGNYADNEKLTFWFHASDTLGWIMNE